MNRDAPATCKQAPGMIAPSVNFARCEGKADCANVCPENVFEIRRIDEADYSELGMLQRLKLRVHGMQVAYAPRADACRACGLCVAACPEHAITLVRVRPAVSHGAGEHDHAEPT
jgi:4Fe-4S ferredoxin